MGNSVVKTSGKVQYEIIRSRRRRRIALRVLDDGRVVVSSPSHTSIKVIDSFVTSHLDWINQRLQSLEQLPKPLPAHTYADGDVFIFLDQSLILRVLFEPEGKTTCTRQGDSLVVHTTIRTSKATIKRAILMWYRLEGITLYESLVAKWIGEIGVSRFEQPVLVDMASFPKRWGSCSQKGELRFALRSLLLPIAVVDYLALHEVAHLLHFNHGSDFKRLLGHHMPDWKERQKMMNMLRLRTAAV